MTGARLWLGCQGWQYQDWVETFYPPSTAPRDMLPEYGRVFTTVEVDSTYYGTPPERNVIGWRDRSPDGFRFSLKVPAEITHERRLRNADAAFVEFVERVRLLGPKLAVLLVQCPPDFRPSRDNRAALTEFMSTQLPGDVRIALELRDARWYDDELFALARRSRFALAATDGSFSDLGLARRVVAAMCAEPSVDFAYVRWLGDRALDHYHEVQIDRSASLDAWADLVRTLRGAVRDIYGYANNHYQGHSPATVRALLERLGEPAPPDTTAPRLL